MDKIDCIVIGAGVAGLAVARRLASAGREVMVNEANTAIGMETSSRNSEVIHAGLYYPTGSLKAALCLSGRHMLYRYCEERGIAHRRCGKLIVATSDAQLPKLAAIQRQAHANGCIEVSEMSARQAQEIEPALSCIAALSSPMTGIVDSHAYMLSLQGDAENAGALFAFNSRVVAGSVTTSGIALQVRAQDGSELELEAGMLINCGGLWAPRMACDIAGLDQGTVPQAHFAKGNYFSLSAKSPFSRLIYPVPEPGGLGVHLTLDLGGQARFGPDVEWLDQVGDSIDYTVDPHRAEKFYGEIRAYWPALPDHSLAPAYAGVRPKIVGPDSAAGDFLFASHGSRHYLGLYGIESPGLTASLAIAEHAGKLVHELS
jgi:L-2-hydroxyglutarate oxidase LhgO